MYELIVRTLNVSVSGYVTFNSFISHHSFHTELRADDGARRGACDLRCEVARRLVELLEYRRERDRRLFEGREADEPAVGVGRGLGRAALTGDRDRKAAEREVHGAIEVGDDGAHPVADLRQVGGDARRLS